MAPFSFRSLIKSSCKLSVCVVASVGIYTLVNSALLQAVHEQNETNYTKSVLYQKSMSLPRHLEPEKIEDVLNISLKLFGQPEYDQALLALDIKDLNPCRKSTLSPSFTICHYTTNSDQHVSGAIARSGTWEGHIGHLIKKGLVHFPGATFVDLGANIGVHALYALAMGHRVWGVEPRTKNLIKLYTSAIKSNFTSRLTLLQHGVDMVRRTIGIAYEHRNIGGSFLVEDGSEPTQTILLSDVINAVKQKEGTPVKIVLKIDIESFECRAIWGSKEIFNDKDVYIPYIFTEWFYKSRNEWNRSKDPKTGKMVVKSNCPADLMTNVETLLRKSGYTPHNCLNLGETVRNVALFFGDLIWIHKDARF